MSQHEYIFIAVSIILGLALTRLLHTMGMIVRSHEQVVFHWAPITWALSVLVFILQLWWIGWGLRSIDDWCLDRYFSMVPQNLPCHLQKVNPSICWTKAAALAVCRRFRC